MTYRKTGSQEYRLPKRGWQAGISVALSEIEKLKREGWVFEIERGAMTQDQANYFMQVADRLGNETKVVPVSDGEAPAVFIGYKPSGKAKAPRPAAPKPKKPSIDPIKEWENLYYKKNPEDMEEKDGAIMDPSRIMAVLRPGAKNETLSKLLLEATTKTTKEVPLYYSKITAAEKKAAKSGSKLEHIELGKNSRYVTERIKEAIRVLGFSRTKKGRSPTAYLSGEDSPVAIVDDSTGWSVVVAPAIGASDRFAETIESINAG